MLFRSTMPGYKMSNKPMGEMKGDGMSGASNERIAMAGGKSPNVPKAAKLASPGKKPAQQA